LSNGPRCDARNVRIVARLRRATTMTLAWIDQRLYLGPPAMSRVCAIGERKTKRQVAMSRVKICGSDLRLVALLIAVIGVAGCRSQPDKDVSEWSAVAILDGRNASAQDMVRATLKRNHIPCFMEGSVIYAVMVPQERLQQAKRALLEDPKLGPSVVEVLQNGGIPSRAGVSH
jgi:hypothetical protein